MSGKVNLKEKFPKVLSPRHSQVADWQGGKLLTCSMLVRIQPWELMLNNVSFLIPFRPTSPERDRAFQWMIRRLDWFFHESQIVIADSSYDQFNRSEARNNALNQATNDICVVLDADTVWNKSLMVRAISTFQEENPPWMIAFDRYCGFDARSTNKILKSDPAIRLDESNYTYDLILDDVSSVGGLIILKREPLLEMGGWDERFIGWGWEDRAFAHSANMLLGPFFRLEDETIFHLWHDRSPGVTTHHPAHEDNLNLYNECVSNFESYRKGVVSSASKV